MRRGVSSGQKSAEVNSRLGVSVYCNLRFQANITFRIWGGVLFSSSPCSLSECTLASEVCDALGDELRRGLGRRGSRVGTRMAAREHEAGAHADRSSEGDVGVGAIADHERARL